MVPSGCSSSRPSRPSRQVFGLSFQGRVRALPRLENGALLQACANPTLSLGSPSLASRRFAKPVSACCKALCGAVLDVSRTGFALLRPLPVVLRNSLQGCLMAGLEPATHGGLPLLYQLSYICAIPLVRRLSIRTRNVAAASGPRRRPGASSGARLSRAIALLERAAVAPRAFRCRDSSLSSRHV